MNPRPTLPWIFLLGSIIMIPNTAFRIPRSEFRIPDSERRAPNSGRDFALFFATDTYTNAGAWRKLYAPVKDARALAADLHDLYGFDTLVVVNPTKNRIREVLTQYAGKKYPKDGQLLVYFTGHGQYIDLLKDGFYIPKDGKSSRDDPWGDTWFKYTDLRRTISGINCPHILLCVDACFSGTLDEGIVFGNMNEGDFDRPNEAESARNQRIADLLRPRTRLMIASGKKDYVPDPSEFARQFTAGLRTLGGADGLLDVHALYHSHLKKASSSPILRSFEQDEISSSFVFDYRNRSTTPANNTNTAAPDSDHDDTPDATDKCPGEYGTLLGCPDSDGDGINDHDDQCPFEAGTSARQGCPAAPVIDSDHDGVLDGVDKCPNDKGKKEWQGCPDSDGDNVPDHKDKCPNEFGLASLNGCPDPNNVNAYTDPLGGTFVKIKGGTFDMGSDNGQSDEKPVHRVTLSDFYMGKFEVTLAQFKTFIDDTGYSTDAEKNGNSYVVNSSGSWEEKSGVNWRHDEQGNRRPTADHNRPVVHVSHNDATAYAEWLSRKTGERYRLPTEAEWEYAAGNGSRHTKYSWGNGDPIGKKGGNVADETAKRQYSGWSAFEGYTDGYVFAAPVGAFDPNELGLHDMSGNVWEWCQDWKGDYPSGSQTNPTGATSGSYRVIRGGSWNHDPTNCRVAYRDYFTPGYRNYYVGFRLARTF